jgi:hypothetical protein
MIKEAAHPLKTKETIFMLSIVAFLALFATYNNCGLQIPGQDVKQNTTPATNTQGNLVTDTWTQPAADQPPMKPEVIFVMDTSGSMSPKVTALSDSIEGWLDQLSSRNLDELCLGVIRAHTSSLTSGKLVAKAGNQLCYCTFGENAVAVEQAVDRFRENLDEALMSPTGSANEEAGIYSMQKALTDDALLDTHQNAGCFRDDTALIPILVSDENDMSAAMDSDTLMFDNDNLIGQGNSFSTTPGDPFYHSQLPTALPSEALARRNYYTRKMEGGPYITDASGRYVNQITHVTLAQAVKEFNQAFPSFGAAIGFYPDRLPTNLEQNAPYWGGQQFAQEFNNPMVDMREALNSDQTAFQNEMNQMAEALANSLQYFYTFDLTQSICDQNQNGMINDEPVQVSVNGQVVEADQYTIERADRLAFASSFAWSPSDQISIAYTVCTP